MTASSSYINGTTVQAAGEEVVWILRIRIRPMAGQPRTHFDLEELNQLADSIKESGGNINPVLVEPIEGDPSHDFELVDGQRRWYGTEIAGLTRMRAIIRPRSATSIEQFITSSVSNFARAELSAIETARMLDRIRKETGWTQGKIARTFGRNDAWVSMHLSLMDLHPSVQALMEPSRPERKRLSFVLAVKLSKLSVQMQISLAQRAISEGLSVMRADALLRKEARKGNLPVRQRRPKKEFERFSNFVRVFDDQAEALLDLPPSAFTQMFAHRQRSDHTQLVARAEALMDKLKVLVDVLKESHPKSK